MNNKRWYILFSVLILLMVIYVFAADFGISSPLNKDDVNITIFQENSTNITFVGISNDVLANGTVLIAKLITLNVTYSGNTTSTNVTWYLDNSSDNAGWVIIAASNGSAGAESATADNATGWGRFNLATQVPWDTDLNASNLTARGRYVDIIVNVTNFTNFAGGYMNRTQIAKKLQLLVYPNELTGEPFGNNTVIINGAEKITAKSTKLTNFTQFANISGTVIFNASLAIRNTTTNVTWYAIRGGSSPKNIVLGSVNEIDNTTLEFNTGNGTLADGRYNITLSITNLTKFESASYVYANQTVGSGYWNTSVFNVMIDNSPPSINLELTDEDGIVYTRGEQKVTCSIDDPAGGSGISDSTRQLEFVKPNGDVTVFADTDAVNQQTFNEEDTAATGEYKVRCSATDGVSLSSTTEKTFSVWARGGPSSATSGGGKKKTVEETEGGEAGAVEQPTGPTGAAVGEGTGAAPSAGPGAPKAGTGGGTVAVIVAIIVIAGVVVYFLVKGKPGKKGQIKFSRAELRPKN